jgi:hypothetical protein
MFSELLDPRGGLARFPALNDTVERQR